jgi:hypothetical protein
MLTQTEQWEKPGHIGSPWKQPINHPEIAYVSWFAEPSAPNEYVEAAFFTHEDEWYLGHIETLHVYAEPVAGETRVYRFIPRNLLLGWLAGYRL